MFGTLRSTLGPKLKRALKASPLFPPYYVWSRLRQLRADPHEHARLVAHYRRFLKPGDLAFDIGAHIGNRTMAFLAIGCRVVAVEPQANSVTVLQRAFGDRATILRAAVSDHDGTGLLRVSDAITLSTLEHDFITETQSSGRNRQYTWRPGESVVTRTLDGLIAEYGLPAFAKIDVEGHELSVLKGLSRAIPALSYEATPEIIDRAVACAERLTQIGDYKYNFSFGESLVFEFPEWQTRAGIEAFLLSLRQDRVRYGDVYATLGPR
jgi:FkbM family methyltransferase